MEIESSNKRSNYFKRLTIKKYFLLFTLVVILVGGYFASKKVQTKGYSGILDFVSTVTSNYFDGLNAHPEEISIEIKEDDYKKLEKNRKRALERGVIINDMDGEYVSATIFYNGKKIDVKLRLKGHMTDHLQNDKWSFRIKTKGNDDFMGMKRFSIQHPGTRGYIYEWIYHELMKQEDIIALRYKFINVKVNGNDWGVYAVEENFESELVENNNRKTGPILRFNPDLYWINRYNMMIKESASDEYASYYSANPEAYRENKVLGDSIQYRYYLKAIGLIEGLRSRTIAVEDAFDIPRLAKFHAIIDLVGGTHSIDWSDIKYYYNPVTSRLEPVAYESFTNLDSRNLSCLYKYSQIDSGAYYSDWHTMIFSNPIFFKEYLKQLERISTSEYLDSFFNKSNITLNENLAIIHKEFPYKKFESSAYYKRQKMISKIIDSPKPLHAYLKKIEGNTLKIQIAAIDALPVIIKSVYIHPNIPGKSEKSIILPAKQAKTYVDYVDYTFVFPADYTLDIQLIDSLKIEYSILGSEKIKVSTVFSFPHTDSEFIAEDLLVKENTLIRFPMLHVDEENKLIHLDGEKLIIDSDLIIPSGYKLLVKAGSTIDIVKNAKVISYSSFVFSGEEDNPIVVQSSDSTSQGFQLIGASKSIFKNVVFKKMVKINDSRWKRTGAITFYESPVEFNGCNFYGCQSEDAIHLIRSEFIFNTCMFQNMKNDALDVDYSSGTITDCVFEKCDENAIDITMSKVQLTNVSMSEIGNKALNVKEGGQLTGMDVKIEKSYIAISAEDFSSIDLQSVSVKDSKKGVVGYKNKNGAGYPVIKINKLHQTHVESSYLKEKKATIVINGKQMEEETKDVELILKNDKKAKK